MMLSEPPGVMQCLVPRLIKGIDCNQLTLQQGKCSGQNRAGAG